MKKNLCPFINIQEECVHTHPIIKRSKKTKYPKCIFNKAIKCPLYKEWLIKSKEFNTELPDALKRIIEEDMRQ